MPIPGGTVSNVLTVFIQDSTSTVGAGKTGLLYNTSGLTAYYKRSNGTASVAITLASISTLGTFVSGGFKEIDATNMPGLYEFDPPDLALATGATAVTFGFNGAVGMVPVYLGVDITAAATTAAAIATAVWQDATSGDFTVASSIGKSLYTSGATPGAAGGLFIAGTNAATTVTTSFTTTFTGNLTGNVGGNVTGTVASLVSPGNIWDVVLTGATHNVLNSAGRDLRLISINTDVIYSSTLPSQAGATSTTVILDSGASAVNQAYQWDVFSVISGTGAGSAVCTGYVGATRTATLDKPWAVQPIIGDVVEITPSAQAQVISYIAGQDPATLVLDVAAASHNTAATIGADINLIGSHLTATPPTAAAIATAIWTDTTAGDFTTSTSPGKIIFTQLGGAFTTTSSSVFSTAALANAPTGGTAPTAAQVATAVWKDLLAGGDFGTAGSIGLELAGGTLAVGPVTLADGVAHGGTLGSSTATLALQAVNVTNNTGTADAFHIENSGAGSFFALNVINSGNFSAAQIISGSNGDALIINGGSGNGNGITIQAGAGGGEGINVTGAPGLTIIGTAAKAVVISAARGNAGVYIKGQQGLYLQGTAGPGLSISASGGPAILAACYSGAFPGMKIQGGPTGGGISVIAGSVSGIGISVTTTSGQAVKLQSGDNIALDCVPGGGKPGIVPGSLGLGL